MAPEKSPAFQFYPADFMADSKVVAMNLQERGAYITLLCLCWMDGSLPASMTILARLCRVPTSVFTRLWPALEPCFASLGHDGSRLVQPRIERERQKQEQYRAMKSAAGQQGGRPKAGEKQPRSRRQAKESPPSSSSSSVSDLPSSKEPTGDVDFERFKQAYPKNRRQGGSITEHAFVRAIGLTTVDAMLSALEQHKQSEQWQTPRLIPLMTTWLNQDRWLQVLPVAGPGRGDAPEAAINDGAWHSACHHDPRCGDGAVHRGRTAAGWIDGALLSARLKAASA